MNNQRQPVRIALVHALHASIKPIENAFACHWPEASIFNLLDDSLSQDLALRGSIDAQINQRFIDLTQYAHCNDAKAILFTCSAFNESINLAKQSVNIPVLKPDEAMLEAALDYGENIAMLATFEPTLASFSEQMKQLLAARNTNTKIQTRYVPDALEALYAGNADKHDDLIVEQVSHLEQHDVLLLAQFSMARAANKVQANYRVPVLTSPTSAVKKLKLIFSEEV